MYIRQNKCLLRSKHESKQACKALTNCLNKQHHNQFGSGRSKIHQRPRCYRVANASQIFRRPRPYSLVALQNLFDSLTSVQGIVSQKKYKTITTAVKAPQLGDQKIFQETQIGFIAESRNEAFKARTTLVILSVPRTVIGGPSLGYSSHWI